MRLHSRSSLALAAVFLLVGSISLPLCGAEPEGVVTSLKPFVDGHVIAGAVVGVASKDKVLYQEAIGSADIAGSKPMRTDSLFWIASMSKPITGAALMILVDEGKVSLDDPIEKFLPEFKGQWVIAPQSGDDKSKMLLKQPARKVTVRDCMNHTSGLDFKSPIETPTLDGLPLKVAVGSYAMMPLLTEPGTAFKYANAGINTGGRIIEVVSGMPYEDFLQKRLFDPLGMKDTTFWPNAEQVTRLAKPYKPNSAKTDLEETKIGQVIYPLTAPGRYPMPGGGLFSTTGDVVAFGRMVLNGGTVDGKRILSEAAIKQMTTKQTADSVKNGYGVGWAVEGATYGHGGALATNLKIIPDRGLVTVFMIQNQGFPGPDNGKTILPTFLKAAVDKYGTTPAK